MRHVRFRQRSRRWCAAAVGVAGLLGGSVVGAGVVPAGAAGGSRAAVAAVAPAASVADGEDLAVSGSFAATGTFDSTADCPSFHTVHTGDGSWTGLGDVTFVLDYCVELKLSDPSPLEGTITVTAAGGTLTGTIDGEIAAVGDADGYPADYTATISGGTGDYADATGSLHLAGHWDDPEIPVFSMHGTVSGTVELPAPPASHPASILDCFHGGWRDFVDDDGLPFRNAGHCVLYVVVHRHP